MMAMRTPCCRRRGTLAWASIIAAFALGRVYLHACAGGKEWEGYNHLVDSVGVGEVDVGPRLEQRERHGEDVLELEGKRHRQRIVAVEGRAEEAACINGQTRSGNGD